MKRKASIMLAAAVLTASLGLPAMAANVKEVVVDGKQVAFQDVESEIMDGYVMIPARFVSEALGLNFSWFSADRRAEITADGFKATLNVNSDEMAVTADGRNSTVKLGKKPVLKNGRMLVPEAAVRTLAEMNGFNVLSADVDKSLIITSPGAARAFVDGKEVSYEGCAPAIVGETPMFPVRFVTQSMGLSFIWHSAERFAVVSGKGHTAVLSASSANVELDNEVYTADKRVLLNGNRLYASAQTLKVLAEFFGGSATVDAAVLNINSEGGEIPTVEAAQPGTGTVPENKPEPEVQPQPEEEEIKVTYNGTEVAFTDVGCIIRDGRTLVPVRAVVEAMRMSVDWNDRESTATISSEGDILKITIDSSTMQASRSDGKTETVELDAPAVIIDQRTYVPIRAVMEFFGAVVEWDGDTRTVVITDTPVDLSKISETDSFKELGFEAEAPEDAKNVKKSIEGGLVARIDFELGGVEYVFMASEDEAALAARCGSIEGRPLTYSTQVNGADIRISAGTSADGGLLARWESGRLKFSLYTSARTSRSDLFSNAAKMAASVTYNGSSTDGSSTDVTAPGESGGETQLPNPIVPTDSFSALGLSMNAPEGASDVSRSIIGGTVAQIAFSYNGNSYVFRGGKTGEDITGVYSSLEDGYVIYAAMSGDRAVSVVSRKVADGGRLATWNIDEAAFSLYTPASVGDEEFEKLSLLCAAGGQSVGGGAQ